MALMDIIRKRQQPPTVKPVEPIPAPATPSAWSGPNSAWQGEYLNELGRLHVLQRTAETSVADRLRQLVAMPTPKSCGEWVTLATNWRDAERIITDAGKWPPLPWETTE